MKKFIVTISFLIIIFNTAQIFSAPRKEKVYKKDKSVHKMNKQTPYYLGKGGAIYPFSYTSENFENTLFPPAGWTVINNDANHTWERTELASGFGIGSASIRMYFYDYVFVGAQDTIKTPVLTGLSAGDSLKFDVAYAKYTGSSDGLKIYISTNGGNSFAQIYSKSGNTLKTVTTDDDFVPTSSQWRTDKVALPATVAGANVVLAFVGINDYGNNLYIDNIRIGTTPVKDLVLESVDLQPAPYVAGTPVQVIANVRWEGTGVAPSTLSLTYKQNSAPDSATDGTNETLFPVWAGSPLSAQLFFSVPYTPVPGTNLVYVRGFVNEDGAPSNDVASKQISATFTVSSFPYFDNFDGDSDSGWTTGSLFGAPIEWIRSTPVKSQIDRAWSGTKCWITNDSNYTENANTYITSPVFDFSSMTYNPVINIYNNYFSESTYDGGAIEMSINGSPFAVVGEFEDINGYNWYDNEDPLINGSNVVLLNGPNWSGTSEVLENPDSGWVNSRLPLIGLAGASGVQFRFRFVSDEANNEEGWAFDNFYVYQSSSIAGNIFEDIDGNGVKDITDPGLFDIEINAVGPETRTVYSDGDGNYSFSYLQPGTYQISLTPIAHTITTFPQFTPYIINVFGNEVVEKDFGIFIKGSIAGNNFWDVNGNQIKDIGETNLANWMVRLSGTKTDSMQTDSVGNYQFSLLGPGNYSVNIDKQAGFSQTHPSFPGFQNITMTSGLNDTGNDFGFGEFGSAAGKVFDDVNSDGNLDNEEIGMEGWEIIISGPKTDTLLTDANGYYSFVGLPVGQYNIIAENRAGYLPTLPLSENYTINIVGGLELDTLHFGRYKFGIISGTVYLDENGNGIKEIGESGIENRVVKLDNGLETLSDISGFYIFNNLSYGVYAVSESLPSGWLQTVPEDTAYLIEVVSGTDVIKDFGNFKYATVSGMKFEDMNANGVFDDNDTPLMSWQIFYNNGITSGSTLTDDLGMYTFSDLGPGSYIISEDTVADYYQSIPGGNLVYNISLTSGDMVQNVDFGNYRLGSISGMVYLDENVSGSFDVGEIGLLNWTVRLNNNDSTSTDENGIYSFNDIIPDDYIVSEDLQGTWTQTEPENFVNSVTVSSNEDVLSVNFGNYQKGSVSGTVYLDSIANGTKDESDASLSELKIFAVSLWGIDSTTTDNSGNYSLHNLKPALYTVSVQKPDDLYFLSQPANDTYSESIVSGLQLTEKNFGLFKKGSISGIVFNDKNNNGQQDIAESGLGNWEIILSGSIVDTIVTDTANSTLGNFSYANLMPGTYILSEILQPIWEQTVPDSIYSITLLSGQSKTNFIFGNLSDTAKFRTFKVSTELSTPKAQKMKFKNGVLVDGTTPNMASALENVFVRIGKTGTTFLGVAQTEAALAKKYAWIAYKNASDLGKLYTLPHDGQSFPIDSLRIAGKKSKKLNKAIKASRKTYNNVAWAEGIMFRLNIIASADSVTPKGFGNLILDTSSVLVGREMKGQTLFQIARYNDSLMTYWDTLGVESTSVYQNIATFMNNVIKPINDRFYESMNVGVNAFIDTGGVTSGLHQPDGKKNAYAIELGGVKKAADINIVKRVPGKEITGQTIIQPFGIEIPNGLTLYQNYPNPFNPTTTIEFSLPEDALVSLNVYNILGQKVFDVANNERMQEGLNSIQFDARTLSSGVYFYRVFANGENTSYQSMKKMILVK
jgi:protocatechuate 3,4-dioxygenase beta subunit